MRIEQAAIELFYRNGFTGTTVREIMQACGQTPGALYNHFESKEELLYRLIREGHDQLDRELFAALGSAGDSPVEQLWSLCRACTLRHTGRRRESAVANLEYRRLSDWQRRDIIRRRRQVRAMFEDVLKRGVEQGVFRVPEARGQPQIKLVAMSMLEMIVRVAGWYRPEHELSADEVAELHASLCLQMLGAERRRATKSRAKRAGVS